jgi:hypothetical protein
MDIETDLFLYLKMICKKLKYTIYTCVPLLLANMFLRMRTEMPIPTFTYIPLQSIDSGHLRPLPHKPVLSSYLFGRCPMWLVAPMVTLSWWLYQCKWQDGAPKA